MYRTDQGFWANLRRVLNNYKLSQPRELRKEVIKRYLHYIKRDIPREEFETLPHLNTLEYLKLFIHLTWYEPGKSLDGVTMIKGLQEFDIPLYFSDTVIEDFLTIESKASFRKTFIKKLENLGIFTVSQPTPPYKSFKFSNEEYYDKTFTFLDKLEELLRRNLEITPKKIEKKKPTSEKKPRQVIKRSKKPLEFFDVGEWLLTDWNSLKFKVRSFTAKQLEILIKLESSIEYHGKNLINYLINLSPNELILIIKKSYSRSTLQLLNLLYKLGNVKDEHPLKLDSKKLDKILQLPELQIYFTRHHHELAGFFTIHPHLNLIDSNTLKNIILNFTTADEIIKFMFWINNYSENYGGTSTTDFKLLKCEKNPEIMNLLLQKMHELFLLPDYQEIIWRFSSREQFLARLLDPHILKSLLLKEQDYEDILAFLQPLHHRLGELGDGIVKRLFIFEDYIQGIDKLLERILNTPDINDDHKERINYLFNSFSYYLEGRTDRIGIFFTPERIRNLITICKLFQHKSRLLYWAEEFSISLPEEFVLEVKQLRAEEAWKRFTKMLGEYHTRTDDINTFYPHYKSKEDIKNFLQDFLFENSTGYSKMEQFHTRLAETRKVAEEYEINMEDFNLYSKLKDCYLQEPDIMTVLWALLDHDDITSGLLPPREEFLPFDELRGIIEERLSQGAHISTGILYNFKDLYGERILEIDWETFFLQNFQKQAEMSQFYHVIKELESLKPNCLKGKLDFKEFTALFVKNLSNLYINEEELMKFIVEYFPTASEEDIDKLKRFYKILFKIRFGFNYYT